LEGSLRGKNISPKDQNDEMRREGGEGSTKGEPKIGKQILQVLVWTFPDINRYKPRGQKKKV